MSKLHPTGIYFDNFKDKVLQFDVEHDEKYQDIVPKDVILPTWYGKNTHNTQDLDSFCEEVKTFIKSLLRKKEMEFACQLKDKDLIFYLSDSYCDYTKEEIQQLGIVGIYIDGRISFSDFLSKSLTERYNCQFGMSCVDEDNYLVEESYNHMYGAGLPLSIPAVPYTKYRKTKL